MFGTLPSYLYFDGEAIAKDGLRKDNKNLIFLVAMITFASCGADNIGVFVPYFITLNLANLIVALLTFLVMIYLWVTYMVITFRAVN